MSKNGGDKVAFSLSLGSKKKRKAPSAVVASEFGSSDHVDKKKDPPKRTLVIPLPEGSSKPGQPLLSKVKPADKADDKAAQALVEAAAHHFSKKDADDSTGGTDFSAKGKLVISTDANTFENSKEEETDQFRKDLDSRPQEVPVDSDVYESVRVSDFGAAMLRGMGWTGGESKKKKKDNGDMSLPRPHRLGLGATPKMPTIKTNKMRRPDQMKRDEQREMQQREYEERRQEQIKMDKQLTMQVGSVVTCNGKRAKMIQLQGVPGLNQVKVQFEKENEAVSVKRGSVSLVVRDELSERPFKERPLKKLEKTPRREEKDREAVQSQSRDNESHRRYNDRDSRGNDHGRSGEGRTHTDSTDRRKDRGDDGRSRRRSRSKDRDSSRDRKRRRNDHGKDEPKRNRQREEHHSARAERHWLIPNIRVRVVTRKFGSRQYKQKGMVLDITPGGTAATLQMDDGQVVERVAERYLETALPKAGGNAIVLTGKHRFAKGKLLERDSSRGVVQVFEDMSILTLSLDDIAQWCGPLDDDLEL